MQHLTSIKLQGRRKRQFATALQKIHAVKPDVFQAPDPIRIVCVSDTHNTIPVLPPGDVLIHAGDLTENGSFDEVQAGLDWLSAQAHTYKIRIAGNHDVLLDEAFLAQYLERRYGQTNTILNFDWGTVIYLQDSHITLEFPTVITGDHTPSPSPRKLTILGSPWTPRYGISAFQYRPDDASQWDTKLSSLLPKPDILVTNGPPKHHLDTRDFHRAGCPYLGDEIRQLRPRLVVFGHIHASYGREDVVLDDVQRGYEDVMTGWAGWGGIAWMLVLVLWARLKRIIRGPGINGGKATIFVNAAVVGGPRNELRNEPIVVQL
ncbi:Metallo-dependent phosphatase-like protein [Xylariaceae sp. FL0804]|nr:Metallo-dependent phosphatase-like protein [Xylariaceae sp. FL0804]